MPKCTASLQLTDTDFSRSFKAHCRSAMAQMREAGQKALYESGSRTPWHASMTDCLSAIVAAQDAMQEKQMSDDWILRGLRRNAMLVYEPDWEKGALRPVTGPVAEYPVGSARLQHAWLKDRYDWVEKTEDGKLVPVKPDYSLIGGSKALTDLAELALWQQPCDPEGPAEEEDALVSVTELAPALQWDCFESGLVTVPLDLQKLAWKDTMSDPKKAAKILNKRLSKQLKKAARQTLGAKFRASLAEKLKSCSLGQALSAMVPVSGAEQAAASAAAAPKGLKSVKKGAGKLVKKAAMKQKLKATEAKAVKQVLKTATAAHDPAAEKAEDQEPLADEGAPGEAAADPVEAAASKIPESLLGHLYGKTLRITQDPHHLCGQSGTCTSHNLLNGTVNLAQASRIQNCVGAALGTVLLPVQAVSEVEPSAPKPLKWKAMRPTKALKVEILSACGHLRIYGEDDDFVAEPLEVIKAPPQMLLDSHIMLGWQMLRWHFCSNDANWMTSNGIYLLDPHLSATWMLPVAPDFVQHPEKLEAAMLRVKAAAQTLLCPLFVKNHWVLLALLQPEEGAKTAGDSVVYFDSMAADSETAVAAAEAAQKLLRFLTGNPAAELPEKAAGPLQQSDDCGFWTLCYMQEVLALKRGEGLKSRGSMKTAVIDCKTNLRNWCSMLAEELEKLNKAIARQLKNEAAEQAAAKKKLEAAVSKMKTIEAAKSHAEKVAYKVFTAGAAPEYDDLPESAKAELEKILDAGNPGLCSRCRWTSGCLSCSHEKALRYHMNALRASLGMAKL
eukprot:s1975_g7.t1